MLSSTSFSSAARPQLHLTTLPKHIGDLAAGQRLTVVGAGRDGIGERLALGSDHSRHALLLDTAGLATAAAILDRLLDDLADLALARWPHWYGWDAPVSKCADHAREVHPLISDPWLKAAVKYAGAGRPPRFRRAERGIELVQLSCAVDPSGVVLIADVDPASAPRAIPVIEALEWCARHGAAVVAALPVSPPDVAPYDRILYGAYDVVREQTPATERFIAPRSRAHHASAVEQRVEAALQRDAELGELFSCNELVPVGGWGAAPRVDLLCREHRIVVELDGPEHRAHAKFGDDRHRDYELLVAGYLVLRLTNEQVEADLPRALEKIRAVVRLRRPFGEMRLGE